MTYLPRVYQLRAPNGQVILDDTEAYLRQIISRTGYNLDADQHEDLFQHLLVRVWQLSAQANNVRSFPAFAITSLRTAAVQWWRQTNGRTKWQFRTHTHTRTLPTIVALDDPGLGAHPRLATAETDSVPDLLRALHP